MPERLTEGHIELGLDDEVSFFAFCPWHGKKKSDGTWLGQRSSNYQGISEHGLLFRCQANAVHTSHLFFAKEPKGTPKTIEDVQAWVRRQKAARLEKPNG